MFTSVIHHNRTDTMEQKPIKYAMSVKEVCEALGCGRTTFWRLRREFPNDFPSFRLTENGPERFSPETVAAFVRKRAGTNDPMSEVA